MPDELKRFDSEQNRDIELNFAELKGGAAESSPPLSTPEDLLSGDNREAPKRARLIFVFKKNSELRLEQKRENRWQLLPILQFLKKDGSPAKSTVGFDREKLTEPVDEETKELFLYLSRYERFEAPLTYFLDYLLEHRNLPLYFGPDRIKARLRRVERCTISFKLNYLNVKRRELTFTPLLTIVDSTGAETIFSGRNNILCHRDLVVFIDELGRVFYRQHSLKLSLFLDNLFLDKHRLTLGEIEQLKSYIEAELADEVELRFGFEKILIKRPLPQPILEIVSENKSFVKLLFNYAGHLVDYKNKNSELIPPGSEESGEILIISRNTLYEAELFQELESFLGSAVTAFHQSWYSSNKSYDFVLLQSVKEFLGKYGESLMAKGFELKYRQGTITKKSGSFSLNVESSRDWFEIEAHYTDSAGKQAPFRLQREDITMGIIELDNRFILIDKDDLKDLNRLLDYGMSKSGKLKVSRLNFGLVDELYSRISNRESSTVKMSRDLWKQFNNFAGIGERERPAGFKGELRSYQQAGFNWLCFLNEHNLNGCLADDMGLGKTVQTLALLQRLKEEGTLGVNLLVVPVSTLPNWQNELKKFCPALTYIDHLGQKRTKSEEELKSFDIIITSYHTLRNDIELFQNIEFNYLILDESQNIKNPQSKIFKAVKIVHSSRRLSLTGTPIENSTLELWSQMDFLNPGLLGTLSQYKKNYAGPIEIEKDEKRSAQLKRLIYPFILRRKKQDVATDLPDKEVITCYCEMQESQKGVYNEVRSHYLTSLNNSIEENGVARSSMKLFEAMLKMRQAALFPQLVDERYRGIESTKFEMLKQMVEEILEEDHKILIFSQFVQTLKLIEGYVKEKGFRYSYIDGSTRNRAKEIDRFQNEDDCRLFLLSLKAAGVGINLTAADYVFLFDPWWNPALESQAIDRSYRIGQTRKVIVYKMVTKDTLEEKIVALQERKSELAGEIITEEESFFKELSKSDIMDLFES